MGRLQGWIVLIFQHTGNPNLTSWTNLGILPRLLAKEDNINGTNIERIRKNIEQLYGVGKKGAVIFFSPDGIMHRREIKSTLLRHEHAMGLLSMKVFLSHKGAVKILVRNYKKVLSVLRFDTWLDEDAMSAGTELERGILKGFKESCAAVFFITPSFRDENYLASEVDYAVVEKREKGEQFSIITLVFEENGRKGEVPDLLRRYVWKEPKNDLDALFEIIKALPIQLGHVSWKM